MCTLASAGCIAASLSGAFACGAAAECCLHAASAFAQSGMYFVLVCAYRFR
jgi:hypothetical protein